MITKPTIYTEEFVLKELSDMLDTLKEKKDIIYIGELFEDKNYTRQRYSEWVKDYKDNKEIQRISDTIKEILETRAVKGAMTNQLNATTTIFHLKNNYDWKDKSEVESTTNHKIEVRRIDALENLLGSGD